MRLEPGASNPTDPGRRPDFQSRDRKPLMAAQTRPRVLTVRCNRATGAWLAVIGSTMLLVLLIVDLLFDPSGSGRFAVPYALAMLLLFTGLNAVLRTTYFTYDPQAERIETRALIRRSFPRTGYDWIAYSTNPLQIREVAPGGASRPVPISHLIADPEDWTEFIDHLHNLSAEVAEPPEEGRP